jgi:hypothetical protein
MRRLLTMLLVGMLCGMGGYAVAQSASDGFFDAAPLYQAIDYSAIHYRYKDLVIQAGTGYALIVFEEFDPVTDRATGRTVVQRRTDTGLAHCAIVSNGSRSRASAYRGR